MRYFSDIETNCEHQAEQTIVSEDLLSLVKKGIKHLLGGAAQAFSDTLDKTAKYLKGEEKKTYKELADDIFNDKEIQDALKKGDKSAIEKIIAKVENAKKTEGIPDETASRCKLGMLMGTAHVDPDNKELMAAVKKAIDDTLKEKGVDELAAQLKAEADAKKAKENAGNEAEGTTAASEEEIKAMGDQSAKAGRQLGGNSKNVKNFISAFWPTAKEGLEPGGDEVLEAAQQKAWYNQGGMKRFRTNYLTQKKGDDKITARNEKNQKLFINMVEAIESFMGNLDGPVDEEKWEFINDLVSNAEFHKVLGYPG